LYGKQLSFIFALSIILSMKYLWHLLYLTLPFAALAQNTSQVVEKSGNSYVFGQIYSDFHYGLNKNKIPRAAFNFNQGIIGYSGQVSEKLKGLIMFDVTRTTNIMEITDPAGNLMDISYFEGSKYTAYLKMAEIRWDISELFSFRVGQLLNTQYLTFQDKFWGYRYVDVTYQEKYRLGMPADFGAQVDFTWKDKLLNQFSVVNGEGPFRHQDVHGKFIYSNNIQYYPTDKITLKLYADYGPAGDTGAQAGDKSVISGFAGYKIKKFRIGGEYTYVANFGFENGVDFYGFSVYWAFVLNDRFQFFGRYDHLDLKTPMQSKYQDYYILGCQYEPVHAFTTALNFRYYHPEDIPLIYASFGLKF
jgi:hypothetical protein